MDALKKPKTPDIVPTDYFRPEEFEKILAATDKYEYATITSIEVSAFAR